MENYLHNIRYITVIFKEFIQYRVKGYLSYFTALARWELAYKGIMYRVFSVSYAGNLTIWMIYLTPNITCVFTKGPLRLKIFGVYSTLNNNLSACRHLNINSF